MPLPEYHLLDGMLLTTLDGKYVFSTSVTGEIICKVKGEGSVSVVVLAKLYAVYVNVSVRVYTVEIQYDFFAGIAFGKGKAMPGQRKSGRVKLLRYHPVPPGRKPLSASPEVVKFCEIL